MSTKKKKQFIKFVEYFTIENLLCNFGTGLKLMKNIVLNVLCQLQMGGWGTVDGGKWSTWNQGPVCDFISVSLQNYGRILAFLGIR